MDTKTKERIALEEEARSIGVSFAPNIGDEKLAERVADAKAADAAKPAADVAEAATDVATSDDAPAAEAPAADEGSIENTEGAVQDAETSESPNPPAQPEQSAQATAAEGQGSSLGRSSDVQDETPSDEGDEEDEDAGPTVTVICHRPDGRRRGDRRWDNGATTVPLSELSLLQLVQLEGDPHFTVTRSDA